MDFRVSIDLRCKYMDNERGNDGDGIKSAKSQTNRNRLTQIDYVFIFDLLMMMSPASEYNKLDRRMIAIVIAKCMFHEKL